MQGTSFVPDKWKALNIHILLPTYFPWGRRQERKRHIKNICYKAKCQIHGKKCLAGAVPGSSSWDREEKIQLMTRQNLKKPIFINVDKHYKLL